MSLTGDIFDVTTTNFLDSSVYYVLGSNKDLTDKKTAVGASIAKISYKDTARLEAQINARVRDFDEVKGFFTNKDKFEKKRGDGVYMKHNVDHQPGEPPLLFEVRYGEKMEKWALVAVGAIGFNTAGLLLGVAATAGVAGINSVGLAVAIWAGTWSVFAESAVLLIAQGAVAATAGIGAVVSSPIWGTVGAIAFVVAAGVALYYAAKGKTDSLGDWDGFPMSYQPKLAELGRRVNIVSSTERGVDTTNSDLTNQFLFYTSDQFISRLASQTKVTLPSAKNPFANASRDDVLGVLNRFYTKILDQLKKSSQFKMLDACNRALQPSGSMSIDVQIANCQKTIDAIVSKAGGEKYLSPEQTIAVNGLGDAIKGLIISKTIITDFRDRVLKFEVDKVFNTNMEQNLGANPTSFGAFMEKFTTYFMAYYDTLEKTPNARKKAGNSTLDKAKKDSQEAKKKATVVDSVERVAFEKQAAIAAADAQIIRVSGSKVELGKSDSFIDANPRVDGVYYAQINTVLDVFKNDTQNMPLFSTQIAVETTSPEILTSDSDLSSACIRVLDALPPTTRQALKVALEAKKSQSLKSIFGSLVNIKKFQSNPMFKLSGYFTGFSGLSFASLAKLPLGSNLGVKDLEAVLDIQGLQAQLDAATRLINSINVGAIADSYFATLASTTKAFTDPFVAAYNSMATTISTVDLRSALSQVAPGDLAKCPSIAELQSYVYNPNLKGTEGISLLKKDVTSVNLNISQEFNAIQNQLDELNKIELQTKRIEDSLNPSNTSKLSEILTPAGLEAIAKQKGSSVGLGISTTSLLAQTSEPQATPATAANLKVGS